MKKVGVVIQGPIRNLFILQKNIDLLSKFFDSKDIVISTWNDKGKARTEQDSFSDSQGNLFGIKTIRTDTSFNKRYGTSFEIVNGDNVLYQCLSTAVGINHFDSYDYIIKVRTDEFYDRLDLFKDQILSDNRIHCGSLFFRNDHPWHIGDHIVGGNIQEMKNLFVGALDYFKTLLNNTNGNIFYQEFLEKKWSKCIFNEPNGDVARLASLYYSDICPEVKITVNYISLKEKKLPAVKNHVELMNKYFNAYDVRKFEKFYVSATHISDGIIVTNNDIDNDGNINIKNQFSECEGGHPEWIACNSDHKNALIKVLIESETRNNSYIKSIDSDFYTFCCMYKPIKIHLEYKDKLTMKDKVEK